MKEVLLVISFVIILIGSIITMIFHFINISKLAKEKNVDVQPFEKQQAYMIVSYTLIIITATAGISKFTFHDYLTNINNLENTKNKNEKEFYLDKIEMLEKEINEYKIYLKDTDGTKAYYENKIKILLEENKKLLSNNLGISEESTINYPKVFKGKLGEAIVDIETNVSIGISDISVNYEASGTFNNEKFQRIGTGYTWEINFNGKKYKYILTKVSWIQNEYEISAFKEDGVE